MRILQVNKFLYRRGGAEGYLLDLAQLQRDAGHEVAFFGMDHPDNEPMPYRAEFPSHVEFEPPPPGCRPASVGRAHDVVAVSGTDCGRSWTTTGRRPHATSITNSRRRSFARARRRGVPVVMTLHDYKLDCPTYQFLDKGEICTACVTGGVRQAIKRRCKDGSLAASTIAATEVATHRALHAYGSVGRFLCPSAFLRDQVAAAGIHVTRLRHLDNFTNTEVPVRTEPGRGVVFAGRLSHEKGVDVLIRAAAKLAAGRDGIVLDIVGDGPDRADLERLADSVAPGAVRFHGRVTADEVRAHLRGARVSAVPSRWLENQPLSVLEAFASGVPVVASALGGLNDLVTPGLDGELVAADDPAAWRSLGRYLTIRSLARHGGANRALAGTSRIA